MVLCTNVFPNALVPVELNLENYIENHPLDSVRYAIVKCAISVCGNFLLYETIK